ncbi:60S ribosomal subunit assembly/export protein LOC1 [Cryomyces minteri]|uniref:60S ribosomal subunit assembly/export protein LOC1 n=1 Tax=Cryomyces minteri TaxID=331657 RepID=A0A4U0VVH8_9PEZI|nr:60S ribosomal subunit assembly/export protein LOC1 [Cryomyces minteri]
MAPTKGKSSSSKGSKKPSARSSSSATTSKSKKSTPTRKPATQQKTKPTVSSLAPPRKKKRIYSEKELGIPKLNMITPAGVQKPKGKKKGKIFVDDRESMMTILAMVNADKEGQIESKMMKARQMEEIREARKKEAEARQEVRKSKLEDTKDSLRRKRKHKSSETDPEAEDRDAAPSRSAKASKKRVSFG